MSRPLAVAPLDFDPGQIEEGSGMAQGRNCRAFRPAGHTVGSELLCVQLVLANLHARYRG